MITKRQLGYLFIVMGLFVMAGALAANYIGGRDAGRFKRLGWRAVSLSFCWRFH